MLPSNPSLLLRPTPKITVAAYTGVGDSQSYIFWGSAARGYSAAVAATGTQNAMDLVDQAGANSVTIKVLTTGFTDVASINAWVTAHSVSTIKVSKLYDQVGTNHFTQATLAKMPSLTLSAIGGLPALTFASASAQIMGSTSTISQATAYTLQAVAERTANFTTAQEIIAVTGSDTELNFQGSANTVGVFGGSASFSATASDSAGHALQATFAGTSTINVDGATQVTGGAGATTSGSVSLGGFLTTVYLDGFISEAGIFASSFNSAIQSNARTAYGL